MEKIQKLSATKIIKRIKDHLNNTNIVETRTEWSTLWDNLYMLADQGNKTAKEFIKTR